MAGATIPPDPAPFDARTSALPVTAILSEFAFEAAPDAIVAVDAEGTIMLANAQTERMLGYSRDELLGRPVEMLVPDDLRAAHVQHRARFAGNPGGRAMGASGEHLMVQRKDGGRFPADISLTSLETGNGLLVAAAIRDATQRLAGQTERDRLSAVAEEERLARRLQQVQRLESFGQLAGGVAHDFNNLLSVIVNYAAFVAEEVTAAAESDADRWSDVASDVEQIQRAADRGISLAHRLLALVHGIVTDEALATDESRRTGVRETRDS